jgi:hypothetical protein
MPAGASYGFEQQLGDLKAIVEASDLDRIITSHTFGGTLAAS